MKKGSESRYRQKTELLPISNRLDRDPGTMAAAIAGTKTIVPKAATLPPYQDKHQTEIS